MTAGLPELDEEIWVLPFKSQEFMSGPVLKHTVAELQLRMDYEQQNGTYAWTTLTFRGVHAYRFTSFDSCRREQVRAYDRLVRVSSREWLATLPAVGPEVAHFRIYFDEVGCYDIAAMSVQLPENDVHGGQLQQ